MKTTFKKSIFIVDDDSTWNMKMTHMLANMGYTDVICFESGEDCIKKLHLNPVIIFLDYQIKAMDGLEVLRKAKDYYPGIGIVFCTENENLSLAVNAMKSGSFDFLSKKNVTEGMIRQVLESFVSAEMFKSY